MKLKDLKNIYPNYNQVVKITDFENFFNVYVDNFGKYKFNLNSTVVLDVDENSIQEYILKYDSHWPLISYNIYQTTRLAWLLMKLNNIKMEESFIIRRSGERIKYLPQSALKIVINSINENN